MARFGAARLLLVEPASGKLAVDKVGRFINKCGAPVTGWVLINPRSKSTPIQKLRFCGGII
jgi:hypothetical protein